MQHKLYNKWKLCFWNTERHKNWTALLIWAPWSAPYSWQSYIPVLNVAKWREAPRWLAVWKLKIALFPYRHGERVSEQLQNQAVMLKFHKLWVFKFLGRHPSSFLLESLIVKKQPASRGCQRQHYSASSHSWLGFLASFYVLLPEISASIILLGTDPFPLESGGDKGRKPK